MADKVIDLLKAAPIVTHWRGSFHPLGANRTLFGGLFGEQPYFR
jgi:hypothetical protein